MPSHRSAAWSNNPCRHGCGHTQCNFAHRPAAHSPSQALAWPQPQPGLHEVKSLAAGGGKCSISLLSGPCHAPTPTPCRFARSERPQPEPADLKSRATVCKCALKKGGGSDAARGSGRFGRRLSVARAPHPEEHSPENCGKPRMRRRSYVRGSRAGLGLDRSDMGSGPAFGASRH